MPRILSPQSQLQVQALKLAESSDRYFELWERLFATASKEAVTVAQLETLFRELGLPVENLGARLEQVRAAVLAETAELSAQGVGTLPVTYIDGRKIAPINQGGACVEKLIDRVVLETARGRARS